MREGVLDPAGRRALGRGLAVLLALGGAGAPGPGQGSAPPGPSERSAGRDWRRAVEERVRAAGLDPGRLGYRPKNWWTAFPRMEGLPFTLPHFRHLFADPLSMPLFVRGMGEAVRLYLPPTAHQKDGRWRRLLYFLGVERLVTGFRTYGSNLAGKPEQEKPLARALARILRRGGRELEPRSFGQKADFPTPLDDLEQAASGVPEALRRPLAKLLLDALDALDWAERARRSLPPGIEAKIFALRELAASQGDGTEYFPEIEDARRALDFHSLAYAAFKAADALERAAGELAAAVDELPREAARRAHLDIDTPFGSVLVTGTGRDRIRRERIFVAVDLGGDDTWEGRAGANALGQALSLALDLGGNDRYVDEDPARATQGAGILGLGLLLDRAGDDRYQAAGPGQGMGLLGIGSLFDAGGRDSYSARYSAQGAGFVGVGLLADAAGDDSYRILAEGQGLGCIGGAGALADGGGNDDYYAEPDAKKTKRGDYHSQGTVSVSLAQGAGAGRRGDGSDGHSYAGGIGVLLDLAGDDHYHAGNFSQAVGYWFGSGFLWDGGGDDVYESVYFTQASGAHFSMAALIDEGGDDVHRLSKTAGAGLAFGWDLVNALLLDCSGNDVYEARIISIASAEVRSNAFLIDLGGDDLYALSQRKQVIGFGRCDRRKDYAEPRLLAPYNALVDQVALLLDLGGGHDRYLLRRKKGPPNAAPGRGDGIRDLAADAKLRNYALFEDDGPRGQGR